jgi:hypothetical protein
MAVVTIITVVVSHRGGVSIAGIEIVGAASEQW